MATKALLAELSAVVGRRCSVSVEFDSAGGTEVARAIRAGARVDLAVLGEQEMAVLDADGFLHAGTLRPLFVSDVAAAVPAGAASLPFATEDDLRTALDAAGRIAYSTGPSGTALLDLLERWQLADAVRPKLVQAPPGTPVGGLLAGGDADLGFQQRSELLGLTGIRILGPLPGTAAVRSTFSGAVLTRSAEVDAALEVLEFVCSKDAEEHVRAAGMSLAQIPWR